MKTPAEQKEWRKQAYGFADIDGYMESVRDAQQWDSTLNAYMSGAASVLSDAQELIDCRIPAQSGGVSTAEISVR